jgi:hypothetical protein
VGTRECRFDPIKEPEKYLPLYVHVVLECLQVRLVLGQWKTGDDSLWLQVFFDRIEQDQSSVTSKWEPWGLVTPRGYLEDEGCVKHLAGSRKQETCGGLDELTAQAGMSNHESFRSPESTEARVRETLPRYSET